MSPPQLHPRDDVEMGTITKNPSGSHRSSHPEDPQQRSSQQRTNRRSALNPEDAVVYRASAPKREDAVVYRAYLTYIIMITNAIAFIWMMSTVNWEFQSFAANQMYGPKPSTLLDGGAKLTSYILSGEWWRLFTATFQHAGLIHLAMTEILLWFMGRDIESAIGHWRFGAIYFSSALFGTMQSAIFIPNVASVGASGAIFGCIGAQVGEWFHYGQYLRNKNRTLIGIIVSSLIGLSLGLVPNIDNYFHIGGWFCGVFASIWVYHGTLKQYPANPKGKLWALGALGVLIVAFIAAFGVMTSGEDANEWCSGCKYLNCVKSPLWDCSYNDCYNTKSQAQEPCS